MKSRIAVFMFFFASIAAFALDVPKPTAEIRKFQVEGISLRDITFLFELEVKNPYPIDLSFKGMTLAFTVEGARVFTADSKGGFTVKAKKTQSNTFSVTLSYDAIIKLVKDYIAKDWLETVIDGTLIIPLPKIPGVPKDITFTYKLQKKIPAIKPRLSVVDFSVKPPTKEQLASAIAKLGSKVDLQKAQSVFSDVLAGKKPSAPVIDPAELDVPLTVSFTIEIMNEAKGPLSFDKLGYELFVNGESLVLGDTTSVIKEAGRTLVTVNNVFSSKKLSKAVKALFTDRKGTFGVKGVASIKLPDEIRKDPVPLSFDESGNFTLK